MSNKTTALAKVSDNISLLEERLKEIKNIETSTWATSGRITMLGGTIDVKTEQSVDKLVMAYANILNSTERLAQAYAALGIDSYPAPKVDGYTQEEWKKDIELRIRIINQEDEKKALTELKNEWVELMDKDDRKALLAQKMEKFLSGNKN